MGYTAPPWPGMTLALCSATSRSRWGNSWTWASSLRWARCFKSENPTVEDLVKYVKLATPPKSNLEKVRLMYRHNLKGNSTNLCPAHPEHRRNSTRRCPEQFSSSPNRPPTRGLFVHWYQTETGTGDCLWLPGGSEHSVWTPPLYCN